MSPSDSFVAVTESDTAWELRQARATILTLDAEYGAMKRDRDAWRFNAYLGLVCMAFEAFVFGLWWFTHQ